MTWTGLDSLSCPLGLRPAQVRPLATAASNVQVPTLILDKPTIGLDTEGVAKVMALVQTLLHEDKAVVIITHDEHVARLAARLVVIEDRQVVFDGSPDGQP